MTTYITIDGGTTNTRLHLVRNKEIISTLKLSVGARKNIENPGLFKESIRDAIERLLKENNLTESDITRILASGMITSEFGLINLPHTEAPAGIRELHDTMKETVIPEISSVPFVFMRGVKVIGDSLYNTDIMRGEETELMGMIDLSYGKCIYILPGSHSKIIKVDNDGRITAFSTMLTGEMIASLSQNTILKDAVDLSDSSLNEEYLIKGYEYSKEYGINNALFKTRILKNIFACDKDETYSFFMGVMLCEEIEEIIKSDADSVALGGKAQIKEATAMILTKKCDKKIIVLDEKTVDSSTALGAVRIYEN